MQILDVTFFLQSQMSIPPAPPPPTPPVPAVPSAPPVLPKLMKSLSIPTRRPHIVPYVTRLINNGEPLERVILEPTCVTQLNANNLILKNLFGFIIDDL